MKKLIWMQIVFVTIVLSQTWTDRASIPTPRWYPGCIVLDEKVYVIGGQDSIPPYSSITTVEVYDPGSDSWETRTPMPTDRWGLMVAVVNDKIYAIGGQSGSFSGGYTSSDAVEEYNTITDTWTPKTPMPTARDWGGSAVINDTIFIFGGYRRPGYQTLSVIEKYYPPTDTWFTEPPMPIPRRTFMTSLVNGKVYLVGGWGTSLVQEYDPLTKIWTTKTSMPTARGGSGVEVAYDQIYIVGGRGGNSDEFECYSPTTDTWISLASMPTPREGLVAGVVDDKLYAITGSAPINQGGLPYYGKNEEADNLTGIEEGTIDSTKFYLFQNQPNPFTTCTNIFYGVPQRGMIHLSIYDISGRRVRVLVDEYQEGGGYNVEWNGHDGNDKQLPSGIYFVQLTYEKFSRIKKCLILR